MLRANDCQAGIQHPVKRGEIKTDIGKQKSRNVHKWFTLEEVSKEHKKGRKSERGGYTGGLLVQTRAAKMSHGL